MGLFLTTTPKERLEIRNKIVLQTGIPCLLQNGFSQSPFSNDWYGRNNLKDFDYTLCRLTADGYLQIIDLYVCRGDRMIQIKLNIFKLLPHTANIGQLQGLDSLQFKLMPNSKSQMQLRTDDIHGIPLFSLRYMFGYKLKRAFTQWGLQRNIRRLTKNIENDMTDIDRFIHRWHELHQPMTTDRTGHPVQSDTTVL